jgi:hypothetical protein
MREVLIMMKDSQIELWISEKGITSLRIHADSAGEQGRAHVLLAVVADEIRHLDEALKRVGSQQKDVAAPAAKQ